LRPGEDGYLLTADGNIIHMVWTVTYRVTDAKRYYLNFYDDTDAVPEGGAKPTPGTLKKRGVEMLLESILANAVLREVATWTVEDVLVLSRPTGVADDADGKRESLTTAVRRQLVAMVEKMNIGIEVQQVSRLEVQPPVSTLHAFREVNAAGTDRQTEIDKAVAYERRVVPESEGRASKVLADARAYQTRIVESVKASSSYFEKVLEEYQKNPETMLMSLHADAVRDVLKRADVKYVIHSKSNGAQEVRLLLGPEPEKPGAAGAAAAAMK
jgi:regulator of protease activity HflC (stomatin/prohibitin superfamily)